MGGRSGQSTESTGNNSSVNTNIPQWQQTGDKAIYNYTNSGFGVNANIRNNTVDKFDKVIIKNLNSALNKEPKFVGDVFRGQTDTDGSFLKKISDNIGGEIKWKGFVSTSKSETIVRSDFGKNNALIFRIKSKTGRDISKKSFVQSEQEVLFKNNRSFKIISVNGRNITLEEIIKKRKK